MEKYIKSHIESLKKEIEEFKKDYEYHKVRADDNLERMNAKKCILDAILKMEIPNEE